MSMKALPYAYTYAQRAGYTAGRMYKYGKRAYNAYNTLKDAANTLAVLKSKYGSTLSRGGHRRAVNPPNTPKTTYSPRTKTRTYSPGSPFTKKSPPRNRFRKKYQGGGYVSKFKPHFKNTSKESYYAKNGIVYKQEDGGVTSDNDAVYIGHAVNNKAVYDNVCRLITKELWRQAGMDVADFTEAIPMQASDSFYIQLRYANNETAATDTSTTTNFTVGTTYQQFSDGLQTLISAATNTSISGINVHSIRLFDGTSAGTAHVPLARISGTHFIMKFDITSKLTLQNTTEAENGTDEADESADNVKSNPIHGLLYRSKKWSNYFQPNFNTGSSLADRGFAPSNQRGWFTRSAVNMDVSCKKPPANWYFKAKSSKVSFNPGEIKIDKWNFTTEMSLNRFLTRYYNPILGVLGSSSIPYKVEFGWISMFGLEKTLDSRFTEAVLTVGWQLDQTYKLACTNSRQPTNAIIQIN